LTPVALLLSGFKITIPPLSVVVIIISASALYHFFFYAISKGQISLTGTIVAGYPLFTILLSYFFLHEQLSPVQYTGIALILTGDVIVALPGNDKADGDGLLHGSRHDYTWVLWGFIVSNARESKV
jgi:drug/metabolite transporter (DMT)-like permease